MGKKDNATMRYMKDNAHFADIFNVAVFDGEQIIKPEDLVPREPEEIGLIPAKGNPGRTAFSMKRVRDILKQAIIRDGKDCRYILLGIENQSDIHYAMPVKCMIYDALDYAGQVEEVARANRKKEKSQVVDLEENHDDDAAPENSLKEAGESEKVLNGVGAKTAKTKPAEFLSGVKREDRIFPVSTLVMYWGSEVWDGPRSLYDMFGKVPEAVLKSVPNYRINLFAPRDNENLDKFTTELGAVMQLIAVAYDKDKFRELVSRRKDIYENLPMEEMRLVNELTKQKIRKSKEKENGNMWKALEDIREEGREEGRAEGREEGRAEGREEGRVEGRAEGEEKARAAGIRILVESLREAGFATVAIAQKLQEKYGLSAKDAAMFL